MKLHLEILPGLQREFWEEEAGKIPPGWVLYGGTAIALRLGHRQFLETAAASFNPATPPMPLASTQVVDG